MNIPEALYSEQQDSWLPPEATQENEQSHAADNFVGWTDWNSTERARDNLLLAHHERKTIAPDNLEQVKISKAIVALAELHAKAVEEETKRISRAGRNP